MTWSRSDQRFTVHVCINGRDWLCQQLQEARIRFTRSDNCLIKATDVQAAQKLLESQSWLDWTGMLNRLLKRSLLCVVCLAELARWAGQDGRNSLFENAFRQP